MVQAAQLAAYEVVGDGDWRDRASVVGGRFLYRHVFPLVHWRGATRLGRTAWFRDRRAHVRLGTAELVLPALDFYWARYFYLGRAYEPEIEAALRLLGSVGPSLFLDCGANYGYWSARVGGGDFGEHRVVAVEASAETFELLARNLGDRALWSAVSDREGPVHFDDSLKHEARQISATGTSSVPGVTIDRLAAGSDRTIIKLDVEGAEVAALAGAAETIGRDVAFLYEDHGADPTCASTAAMLAAGLQVFDVTADGVTHRMSGEEDVRSRKHDPSVGYNFVAAGGAFAAALGAGLTGESTSP